MEQGVIRWWPLLGGPDPLREQCRRSFADKAPSKAATRSLGASANAILPISRCLHRNRSAKRSKVVKIAGTNR